MEKTLGGERLHSGNRMKVQTSTYERSTHNLSKKWKSSMAAGTVVPFMSTIGLPGDTWDIELAVDILTKPTTGPLFGKYDVYLEVFTADFRLYSKKMHNNRKYTANDMENAYFPYSEVEVPPLPRTGNIDNAHVNPSSLYAYLGYRGFGNPYNGVTSTRRINAMPIIIYYDIGGNYYMNLQEEKGYIIDTVPTVLANNAGEIQVSSLPLGSGTTVLPILPAVASLIVGNNALLLIDRIGPGPQPINEIIVRTALGNEINLQDFGTIYADDGGTIAVLYNYERWGTLTLTGWRYATPDDIITKKIQITPFPAWNLDMMRDEILEAPANVPFDIDSYGIYAPYSNLKTKNAGGFYSRMESQQGLMLCCYSSDVLNNWLNKATIDNIALQTRVATAGGGFTIDALILANKMKELDQDLAVGNTSVNDWIEAVWDHQAFYKPEIPIYRGGLVKEIVFQEVISNSASNAGSSQYPIGSLAGKGRMGHKHEGGKLHIKIDEPCYIMGMVRIVPRLDYSQGNGWDMDLVSINEIHMPKLDQIGFQPSVNSRRAHWSVNEDNAGNWVEDSAGYVPAWIDYMTEIDEVYGTFAEESEGFMVLRRRYEPNFTAGTTTSIMDLTTYIDPSKYNHIFAVSALDSQNFWVNINRKATVRRKMSAKIMPRL